MNELKTISDYQKAALMKLGPSLADYIQKTAGEGKTYARNLDAFGAYDLVPLDSKQAITDMSVRILDTQIEAPIMIAPTAWHKMFTPKGESDTSLAAKEFGTKYAISSFSTLDFSEIGKDISHTWYQLLMYKDLDLMKKYITKAEKAGCSGIVLTVDALTGCSMCKSDPSLPPVTFPVHQLPVFPENPALPYTTLDEYYEKYMPMTLKWDDVKEIVSSTKLPIIVKGILTPEAALQAVAAGAKAIIVSNHGGRQDDTAPGTLSVLTLVANAAKGKVDVYLDGGIRTGSDIFKALALGAKAVLIGRPALYGLAVDGKHGLLAVLGILRDELITCMRVTGCTSIQDITLDKVIKKG